ncbi:hypothetical protein [Dyella japonica]|uniref:DUF29 domain-containing protein n=1 Tax=Dyella japonica TaxID=231455 RepID=A0ABV2JQD2_9GAMM
MIDRQLQYVEWAAFVDELDEAREHLEDLIKNLKEDLDYGEPELRAELGHVFAHLNRAWRRSARGLDDAEWEWASQFPDDLTPMV